MGGKRPEETAGSLSVYARPILAGSMSLLALLAAGFGIFLRFSRRKPLGGIGAVITVSVIVVAIIAPLVAPFDPIDDINLLNKYAPPGSEFEGDRFLLGTDDLGRDTLSRLLFGARISLYVGFVSVAIGVTAGALLGMISAYIGGTLDLAVQRIVDAFMAFPPLILALGIMAVLGQSLNNVIFTLVILFIPGSSRVVRSEALRIKETAYVEAARAVGSSDWRIILRHMLPNCMAPYIVFATANLGLAIVVEASLSFLGIGAPLDAPSWGSALSIAGQRYVEVAPWLLLFPSLAISVVVFGFNLLGDSLRDVLDPRLRGGK